MSNRTTHTSRIPPAAALAPAADILTDDLGVAVRVRDSEPVLQATAGGVAEAVPLLADLAEGLLTISEAAVVLNVPRTWLRDKVTGRQVPHTRLGRHVRFTPAHLAQIVAAGEQQPRPSVPQLGAGRRRRA